MTQKLYKLRSLGNVEDFNRVKNILETGHFWCSQFSELNDPMEGVFLIDSEQNSHNITFFSQKNRFKICSFSNKRAFWNPIMWGYYANGFKGIAIELEVDVEDENIAEVLYSERSPTIEDIHGDDDIKKILTTKLRPWEHEGEYRFLKISSLNFHKIGRITAVYFGDPYGHLINTAEIQKRNENIRSYIDLKEKLKKLILALDIDSYSVKVRNCKVEIVKT